MKNKIVIIALITLMLICVTGCGNTKTLTCTATGTKDGSKTTSDLEIKIKDDEVKDMSLTLVITVPKDQVEYKQMMISQLQQKTDKVYNTGDGVKAIFDMNNSYFSTLGISKDASYSELKQVLELQGYTCEE